MIPRLLEENLPSDPAAALRHCEDQLREAFLLLAATRLFNQLYERNTRSVQGWAHKIKQSFFGDLSIRRHESLSGFYPAHKGHGVGYSRYDMMYTRNEECETRSVDV